MVIKSYWFIFSFELYANFVVLTFLNRIAGKVCNLCDDEDDDDELFLW